MIDLPMSNPISPTVRGWLYVGSTVIGILAVIHVGEAGVDVPRRAADDDYGYPDQPDHGEPDQTLAALDIDAPDGYETSEAAKTLVADILGTDFGGYNNGDLDTLVAADQIINQLVAAGWRPTAEDDPYFVSEALLREIDRQRE